MPTLDDSQYNNLKKVTDDLTPVYDKFTSGDTNITDDDMDRFDTAYKTWKEALGS